MSMSIQWMMVWENYHGNGFNARSIVHGAYYCMVRLHTAEDRANMTLIA
jgi:hypothetical protein